MKGPEGAVKGNGDAAERPGDVVKGPGDAVEGPGGAVEGLGGAVEGPGWPDAAEGNGVAETRASHLPLRNSVVLTVASCPAFLCNSADLAHASCSGFLRRKLYSLGSVGSDIAVARERNYSS